jgi:hypothetical protein
MPRPGNLSEIEVSFEEGYFPSAPALSPKGLQRTIRRGGNCWLNPRGLIEVAKGLLEVSSTNVGARLFAADIQRASIAGGLVGSRLPYAGLLRYQNAVLFYLSENASAQVYLNETAISGLTTSATAGRLRVAVPNGGGGYNVFDAGFDKPTLTSGDVTVQAGSEAPQKAMAGSIGVALAPWRTTTDAVGPPSDVIYSSVTPNPSARIKVHLPAAVSGQDGWIYAGTRWGDQSGEIRVVRYVYIQPRGTFTATNGSPNLTAGVGTFWTRDLRPGDVVTIDAASYTISAVTSNTTATLTTNFTGTTNPGKVMTITDATANWFNSELGALVSYDTLRPPRAAGVLQYAGRVLLWGCRGESSSSPTGSVIIPTLPNNPEHVGLLAIVTASGSDLVNVLAADGPMYLMTTTSLEVVTFTGDPAAPYIIRIIAEPGFKAGTNGVLYKDVFYGFNNRPLRTQAGGNIDVEFAQPVWSDMRAWDASRVIVAVDPEKDAVLYMFDNGSTTVVIPYMAQLGVWGPPINFAARIIDTQVVNGALYVTYLSGGNYRVNKWEGGAGIGGLRYIASQYYDVNFLNRVRVKNLVVTGKIAALRTYAVTADTPIPDVSDSAAATQSFFISSAEERSEAEIFTNIEGRAFAFRCDFASNDGSVQKIVARGLPRSERR